MAGDFTGNGHYGTLSSGVTAGVAGPPTGDGTTSMAFHGTDAVTVASMAGLPSGAHPYSLEAWVLPAAAAPAAQGLLGYGNYAATRQASYLRLAGPTGLLHSWRNDDLAAAQTTSLTGTWHLATASYDGHGRRLYLDGVPFAADAPANQPNVVLANLALGQTNGTERLTGSLANVAIYPYALTPAQVGRHYALGQHSPAPTPVTNVVQYTYDAAGRLATVVYPDLRRETHASYDPAGRPTGLSLPDGTSSTLRYNAAGQRTEIAFPNGGKQLWAYDAAGRPHDTWWAGPGSTVPFTQTATLDAAGQRTVLQDTAGSTTYGYDGAGRLTSAGYPGGSTEANSYDPLGDRTTITSTTVLSGTAVTTNSFDAAAQLTTSVVTGGQPGTTTYSYDGNGNQTGSAGPAGTVTNTFNQQDQLTHVSGPSTNETFVYDGQGDRLRAYDQSTANYQLHTLVHDLCPGGMSGLLSDGAADYGYADFGVGAAPVARMDAGSSQGAYLAADLLGSVRLATNPSDQTLGSGTYDAWGNARPTTADAAGQVLLAGLQASAPFGYAGQAYDAGPGTYGMRARQYDPAQGRFQSTDPQAPSQGYPVTLNPYQYAGDMVTGTTDPSGRGWVWPGADSTDFRFETTLSGRMPGASMNGLNYGVAQAARQQDELHPTHGFWVPVLTREPQCGRGGVVLTNFHGQPGQVDGAFSANIVVLDSPAANSGQVWDIEHVESYLRPGGRSFIEQGVRLRLQDNALRHGFIWPKFLPCGANCEYTWHKPPQRLRLGTGDLGGYLALFNLPPGELTLIDTAQLGLHDAPTHRLGRRVVTQLGSSYGGTNTVLYAWEQEPGLVLYATTHEKNYGGCPAYTDVYMAATGGQQPSGLQCFVDGALTNDGVGQFWSCPKSAIVNGCQGVATVLVMVNFVNPGKFLGPVIRPLIRFIWLGKGLAKGLGGALAALKPSEKVEVIIADQSGRQVATTVDQADLSHVLEGFVPSCGSPRCFPAGTRVATPGGGMAIERLRTGDLVLAEDPKTGKVEAEPVEAVITRPSSPLLRLDLSDGSTLKVQPNHRFWVDGGPGLHGSGWLEAGQLRPGDRLRTAGGTDVTVTAVEWNQGEAVVYTLTVATDHTFFVGTAQVLVHNANGPCLPLGFSSPRQFEQFGTTIRAHLSGLVNSEESYLAGSAATGVGYHSGAAFGPGSDIDIAIVSKDLYQTIEHSEPAKLSVDLGRSKPNPLPDLLDPLRSRLSALLGGREVNIAVYETRGAMYRYHGETNVVPIP